LEQNDSLLTVFAASSSCKDWIRIGDFNLDLTNGLLMFMRVHSWILLGSWWCLCTEADRKTRSSNGVS
jgi:hypothetical protein